MNRKMKLTRKQVIDNLIFIRDCMLGDSDENGTWRVALSYAISSLKTDEAYQIMYEGGEIFTKADIETMLSELKYDLYQELCKEIHGKEDCPCTNQTTSCLATFRVCDANRAINKVIQQRIDKLKGEENGNGD